MKILGGKRKSLLVFSSFSVCIFLLVYFLIIPMIKKVYENKDQLEESRLTLKRDKENISRYREDLAYLEANKSLNEGLVINENNRIELIKDLEEIAKNENIKLEIEMYQNRIIAKKTNKEAEPQKTSLKLFLTGEYSDFLVFLNKLHNFKYIVNIEKVTIEKFDDSSIRKMKKDIAIEDISEMEGEIIISFIEEKI